METNHATSPRARAAWIAVALLVAAVLFWLATSDAVYDITSPPKFSLHVLFRKAYSIVAFALVGFTADKALGPTTRPVLRAVLLVAAYSGAIEIAQARLGSHEGPEWNAMDVICGAIGGGLGVVAEERIRRLRRRA